MSDAGVEDPVLHVREWGEGDRIALLVHGLTGDSGGWWQVAPALADLGYRVLAPDLPGHGLSPRFAEYRWTGMAAALTTAISGPPDAPVRIELAIGHSLGGRLLALAVAAGGLAPAKVIFEDPAWSPGNADIARGFQARKNLTAEQLEAANPRWAPRARDATLGALDRWDAASAEPVRSQTAYLPGPEIPPALVLLADPSPVVSPEAAAALTAGGHTVRTVAGTGHIIHNDDFEGFVTAIRDRL